MSEGWQAQADALAKVKRPTDVPASVTTALGEVLGRRFPLGAGEWCGVESGERNLADLDQPAWTCTMEAGHEGFHAAHGLLGQVLVVFRG